MCCCEHGNKPPDYMKNGDAVFYSRDGLCSLELVKFQVKLNYFIPKFFLVMIQTQ